MYIYIALNSFGNKINGIIHAESKKSAEHLLIQQNLIPIKIKKQNNFLLFFINFFKFKNINFDNLMFFTKQLKTMLSAGLPIIKSLSILKTQTYNKNLKKIIDKILLDLNKGLMFSESLKKYPYVFSNLYTNMIGIGEKSGSLINILNSIILNLEFETKLKKNIKTALRYPIIVVAILIIAFFVLLMFVLPKFMFIFSKTNVQIPLATQICLFLYNFIITYWIIFFVSIIILSLIFFQLIKTQKGTYLKDYILLSTPIIGNIIKKTLMARFANVFAILHKSGISLLETIDILQKIINNKIYQKELNNIYLELNNGSTLTQAFQKHNKYFTDMEISLINIGEQTGNLDEMLLEIAKYYNLELEYKIKKLTDSFTPVLTIILTFFVGFFALAIFLPLWDLTKTV